MAIRIRIVDGVPVALCAARSVAKPGDLYLDDGQHYALAEKFWKDYADRDGLPECSPETAACIDREESNNANREDWERTYGGAAA